MEAGRIGGGRKSGKTKNISKREEFEGVSRLPLVGDQSPRGVHDQNISKREEFEGVSRLPLVGYARISLVDLVN